MHETLEPLQATGGLMLPLTALTTGFVLAAADAVPASQSQDFPLEIKNAPVFTDISGEQQRQGVTIGEIHLMVGYEAGSELTQLPALFRIPNVPSWFVGMANMHGLIVPVFDLIEYLGVRRTEGARQMLLVLGHGANASGVLIDGLPQRLRWNVGDDLVPSDAAPEKLLPHVRAACLIQGLLWFDLDVGSLQDTLEQQLNLQ